MICKVRSFYGQEEIPQAFLARTKAFNGYEILYTPVYQIKISSSGDIMKITKSNSKTRNKKRKYPKNSEIISVEKIGDHLLFELKNFSLFTKNTDVKKDLLPSVLSNHDKNRLFDSIEAAITAK